VLADQGADAGFDQGFELDIVNGGEGEVKDVEGCRSN
jgi:hypothetical protein